MVNETKWHFMKRVVRFWLCRHRNTEVRTVRAGSKDNLKVIYKFKYCFDCKSQPYDKEVEAFNESLRKL